MPCSETSTSSGGREMGKGRKGKKKPDYSIERFIRPTDERVAHNDVESAGAAMRVVPVIDTMLRAGQINQRQYDALAHYRQQAHRAEDDCAEASVLAPEKCMGGGHGSTIGGHIPARLLWTPAIVETGRIERDLGSLLAIARAIAVDDVSLARWCIDKFGGEEAYDKKSGSVVAIVPKNPLAQEMALLELRWAAGKITQ